MEPLTLFAAVKHMLLITMFAVCIITIPTLVVGLVISIIQAATQINEMTMTFIPKLIVMFLVLIALMPWLLDNLVSMTQELMLNIPSYIR
jgi:flagellar biosynthesis protein FliQ